MSQLLTNAFELPPDGWYQISALGEFPHNPTGLMQILDEHSCRQMAEQFATDSSKPNFPGILIDFDHFSLEKDKPSEAAGWIVGLEPRPNGLWAQIRWSDRGEQAVKGGRYRFISPVWRQDECEDLGNKRVRPRRLINAAVTNDPNISGMVPLSNRRVAIAAPSTALPISSVSTIHFLRGALLANGLYWPTTPFLRNRSPGMPMTDDQRKAMFARLGTGGRSASRATAAPDESADSSSDSTPGLPSAADTPANVQLDSISLHEPTRQSADRVEEIKRQIRELEEKRTEAPVAPDYEEVDVRALQRQMMSENRSINEIRSAVTEAEAQNRIKRDALQALKAKSKRAYPGNSDKQRAYLDKLLADEQKIYQKAVGDWNRQNKSLQDKIDKLVAARNTEEIRFKEELYKASQRDLQEDATAQARAAREQEAAARRQLEEDKRAAREREAAAEKARKEAEKANASPDPASAYRSELGRRRLYWQAAARGEWEVARQLYPKADHERNRKDLEALIPPSQSKANQAAYAKALERLQSESP